MVLGCVFRIQGGFTLHLTEAICATKDGEQGRVGKSLFVFSLLFGTHTTLLKGGVFYIWQERYEGSMFLLSSWFFQCSSLYFFSVLFSFDWNLDPFLHGIWRRQFLFFQVGFTVDGTLIRQASMENILGVVRIEV